MKTSMKFLLVATICVCALLFYILSVIQKDSSGLVSKPTAATWNHPTAPPHAHFQKSCNMVTTRPWKKDPQCGHFNVCLGVDIPQIYLASYPRSGNTWTRYMLEGATGYLGEYQSIDDGSILFIKRHYTHGGALNITVPVIFIIRNPRHSITSFHTFREAKRKDAFLDPGSDKDFEDKRQFSKTVRQSIDHWKGLAIDIISTAKYLHVTYYEDLKKNPMEELLKMLNFVGIPIDPGRIECLTRHYEGLVNRGQPEYDPYTEIQKRQISDAVDAVSKLLQLKGYPPLPYSTQANETK